MCCVCGVEILKGKEMNEWIGALPSSENSQ